MFHVEHSPAHLDQLETLILAKILSIANQKGGVGKTTTALNLAACLAYAEQRVLLIDLDPQGNTTSGIGSERIAQGGAELLFRGGHIGSSVIRETRVPLLLLVPSSGALRELDRALAAEGSRDGRLRSSLRSVADRFDFIIIDCPPSLGTMPINALVASEGVIIPIQCEYYAMEGLAQILGAIDSVKHAANPQLAVEGILLTMWDGSIQLTLDVESEVRSHFPDHVYQTVIPRDPALAEAPSHGLPIIDYEPRSKAASCYIRFTKEVLGHARTEIGERP